MKRIINGKRYDTTTAELVASHAASCPITVFSWFEEKLYRTRRGAWFLAGEGHAMSKYAESFGQHNYGPGEGLRPLTAEEAREWLEEHEQTEALEEHFGATIEDA